MILQQDDMIIIGDRRQEWSGDQFDRWKEKNQDRKNILMLGETHKKRRESATSKKKL